MTSSNDKMSQTESIVTTLIARRPAWVPMPELAAIAGCYAVHSRCAEARKSGINIENKVERAPDGKRHSYYRIP